MKQKKMIACQSFKRINVGKGYKKIFEFLYYLVFENENFWKTNFCQRLFRRFWTDISQIRQEKNGSLSVTVYMPEDEWLLGYLLTFGVWIEIIEPIYLKRILAASEKLYKRGIIFERNLSVGQ